MIKLKKSAILALLLAAIIISGCKGKTDSKKLVEDIRTGTQGLVVNFMTNSPPPTIHAEGGSDNSFDVILELRNKGAFPQAEEIGEFRGNLWIGYN